MRASFLFATATVVLTVFSTPCGGGDAPEGTPTWRVHQDAAFRALQRGDAGEARDLLLDAMVLADGAGAPHHFFERCMESLGRAQLEHGDPASAEFHLRAAYIVREARAGAWNPETGELLDDLVRACRQTGRSRVAETMAQRAADIRSRADGSDVDAPRAVIEPVVESVIVNAGATLVDDVSVATPPVADVLPGALSNVLSWDGVEAAMIAHAQRFATPEGSRRLALVLVRECRTELAARVLDAGATIETAHAYFADFLRGTIDAETLRNETADAFPADTELFVAVMHAADGRWMPEEEALLRAAQLGADPDRLAAAATAPVVTSDPAVTSVPESAWPE